MPYIKIVTRLFFHFKKLSFADTTNFVVRKEQVPGFIVSKWVFRQMPQYGTAQIICCVLLSGEGIPKKFASCSYHLATHWYQKDSTVR